VLDTNTRQTQDMPSIRSVGATVNFSLPKSTLEVHFRKNTVLMRVFEQKHGFSHLDVYLDSFTVFSKCEPNETIVNVSDICEI